MDDGLKQRIVGAVVLTAVAVLFLPVLFERKVRYQVDTTTRIPPAPPALTTHIREPIRPQGMVPAKDPETMFQPEASEPVDESPETSRLDPQGLPRAWVVQVASFKSEQRAQKLVDRLLADGHKAYSRKVKTSKGEAVRVFVGPKIDKEHAFAVKKEVDKVLGVESLVLRFKP